MCLNGQGVMNVRGAAAKMQYLKASSSKAEFLSRQAKSQRTWTGASSGITLSHRPKHFLHNCDVIMTVLQQKFLQKVQIRESNFYTTGSRSDVVSTSVVFPNQEWVEGTETTRSMEVLLD